MSNSDSFIEEVNEEVRRDRLYGALRRYGWIGVVAILAIVGGAAFSEYRKAQTRSAAQALGDGMLAALAEPDASDRSTALEALSSDEPLAAAVRDLLIAAQQAEAGDTAAAVATLEAVAVNADVPQVYRTLAQFKALALQGSERPVEERRQALEAMAQPGQPMRLLASEQLALIEIETGTPQAAIDRYQSILVDAETSPELQQRALQMIVALGGEPELADLGAHDQSDAMAAEN